MEINAGSDEKKIEAAFPLQARVQKHIKKHKIFIYNIFFRERNRRWQKFSTFELLVIFGFKAYVKTK